jgi:iron complex outermembrane receptor protein
MWSDSASTRLYFQLYDANAAFPGNLTEEQFKEDPTQRQLGFDDSSELVTSLYRTYLKTNWECGEDEYMIYGYYQYFDNNAFVQVNTPVGPFLDTADLILQEGGIGARGKTHWLPFGHSNILRSFIGADFGNYEYFAQQGPTFVKQDDTSENFQVYLENETILDERHHAFLGLGWIQTRRQTEQIESFPPRPDRDDKDDSGIWRVGYLYDLNEQSQLFANINQSFEAPSFPTLNASLTPLAPQKALTYELGTRFRHQWIKGSLTAYYAEVENEFIAFQDSLTGSYFYTNEDTTHQGIEAFLTVDLTEAWSSSSTYQLDLDMSYQLNDFTFDEGENSGNKLPGISPHVIASQLRLTAPTGKWNTALNLRYLPEGLVANNENTLRTDGFAVWGWAAEYIHNEHLSFYGGIDNLFDKNYANQVAINPITPSYINPGDGRAAYIGARLHW